MAGDTQSTDYGPIANYFECAPLGTLCVDDSGVQTGPFGSQLHQEDYVAVGTPIITVEHLGENRITRLNLPRVSDEDRDRLSRYLLQEGDIVFSRVGSVDRRAIVRNEENGWLFSGRCLRVRIDKKRICPEYLSWFFGLEGFTEHIRRVAVGATMPSINTKILRDIRVYFPPLSEQRAIAAVLGALDDKIELNRRMNVTLEGMARALFQSWFVDFDPIRAKLDGRQPTGMDKETAGLFPDAFEESPIGKKPIGWEVKTLETALTVLEVGGRPKGGVGGITSGIPSIGAESIVGVGRFDFGKTKYVPVEFYETMKKGHIQSHDVLLYKDGGRPGEYEPHVSMFGDGFPFDKCSINEHVYRLRTNDQLSQEYLYFWLSSELAMAEMRVKGTGVAIPGLNSTAVRSLTTVVPPTLIVNAFTNQAAPLVTRILANSKQSRNLATLRDTLLPKLLSGDLSVAEREN